MTIYVMLVDPQEGRYMAIATDDPALKAFSCTGVDEAVGRLIASAIELRKTDPRRSVYVESIHEIHTRAGV